MAEKNEESIVEEDEKKDTIIPIDWHVPEGVMTPFATNMLVQTIETEFKISFFEIKPAIRLNKSDPLPESVRADCVASVIISANRLPKFVEVLQLQVDKLQKKTE